jgi:hypothetical protein
MAEEILGGDLSPGAQKSEKVSGTIALHAARARWRGLQPGGTRGRRVWTGSAGSSLSF